MFTLVASVASLKQSNLFLSRPPVCWPAPLKAGSDERPAARVGVSSPLERAAGWTSRLQTPAAVLWACISANMAADPLYLQLSKERETTHTVQI